MGNALYYEFFKETDLQDIAAKLCAELPRMCTCYSLTYSNKPKKVKNKVRETKSVFGLFILVFGLIINFVLRTLFLTLFLVCLSKLDCTF